MKIKIVIVLLFLEKILFSQGFDENFLWKDFPQNRKIEKIEETRYNDWTICTIFNSESYLTQKISYHKKKKKSDCKYTYSFSDSLITVNSVDTLENESVKRKSTARYYYNILGQMSKYRFGSSDLVNHPENRDNFVYNNGILSFTKGAMGKIDFKYIYNGRQLLLKLEIRDQKDTTFYHFQYDQLGQLTDEVMESKSTEVCYSDVVVWSNERPNKVHIKYSNFDKNGNWTKSFFVTKKGLKYRSRRYIEYFPVASDMQKR